MDEAWATVQSDVFGFQSPRDLHEFGVQLGLSRLAGRLQRGHALPRQLAAEERLGGRVAGGPEEAVELGAEEGVGAVVGQDVCGGPQQDALGEGLRRRLGLLPGDQRGDVLGGEAVGRLQQRRQLLRLLDCRQPLHSYLHQQSYQSNSQFQLRMHGSAQSIEEWMDGRTRYGCKWLCAEHSIGFGYNRMGWMWLQPYGFGSILLPALLDPVGGLLSPVVLHLVVVVQELPEHQLLEDLLKRDHASGLSVALPHHHRQVHMLLLQLVHRVQQRQVFIQSRERQHDPRGLEGGARWGCLEEKEVLEFDEADDVGAEAGVDGDLAEVVLLQGEEEVVVDLGVLTDHEHVVEGDHVVLDLLEPQVHGVLQNLDLLRPVPVLPVVVQAQDRPQVLRGQHDLVVVVAQPVVQHIGDRPHEHPQQQLQEPDERREVVPDCHLVRPSAVGLREHLSEDDHCDGGDDDGQVAGDDLVEEDGQRLQRERVREQEGGEQQVVVVEDVEDGPRHPPLVLALRVHPDLHLRLADRHVPHRQTRTHTRETAQQE